MATAIKISPFASLNTAGCPACHALDTKPFVDTPQDNEYFVTRAVDCKIVRCANCDALYQTPFPSAEETNSFYGADYQNYSGSKVPLLATIVEKQNRDFAEKFVSRYSKDCTVLDFGCGNGGFLKSLQTAGVRDLHGYDVALRFETDTIKIYNSLEDLKNAGVQYDVIRMNHVIEHLADLDGVMSLLASLLKPNGRLIGQTPNAAHYTSNLFGTFWGPLHYPYHTVLFAEKSLRLAAPRWNLKLDKTEPYPMPTGWAMSFENIFKKTSGSKKRGRSMLYTLFMAGSAPFVILDAALKNTAIFDFELVKQ